MTILLVKTVGGIAGGGGLGAEGEEVREGGDRGGGEEVGGKEGGLAGWGGVREPSTSRDDQLP